jgi:hypothetical protein
LMCDNSSTIKLSKKILLCMDAANTLMWGFIFYVI